MVKLSDRRQVVFASGFDLARHLTNADFRNHLKSAGWRSGDHIVMAADDEPVVEVVNKVMLHSGNRALIAVANEHAEYGFRLMLVTVARERKRDLIPFLRRRDIIPLDPGTSIGMLYDSFQHCGTYVPSEWSKALLFEKVSA